MTKKVNGCKRQLIVDTGGRLWAAEVHAANQSTSSFDQSGRNQGLSLPVYVHGPFLSNALEGVRPEKVALRLNEIGGQISRA